jgi:trans-aconitate methyltransferase
MTRAKRTLKPTYFQALYARDNDPWRFASSAYERNKYAVTLAALPNAHYASAFEVGCSIGVLTRQLATRCDRLLAVDVAQAPLAEAMRRCADVPSARFAVMFVPEQWPDEVFDLILLSEVVYYLSPEDVVRLGARICDTLAARGDVVLVHWTGETDYPLSGDEAAERLVAILSRATVILRKERFRDFRLDVLRRR